MSTQRDKMIVKCPKCGSTHFLEAEYRQYLSGPYASAPGGELSVASSAIKARVCICNEPVLATSLFDLSPQQNESMQNSFRLAAQYRRQWEPEALIAGLRQAFADRAEFQSLMEAVEKLRQVADRLDPQFSENGSSESTAIETTPKA